MFIVAWEAAEVEWAGCSGDPQASPDSVHD